MYAQSQKIAKRSSCTLKVKSLRNVHHVHLKSKDCETFVMYAQSQKIAKRSSCTLKVKRLRSQIIVLVHRGGGDRMVVGFTTTCAISTYHH
jgi:hypothetical protein